MSGKIEIDRDALLAAANQLSNWGKTVMAAPLWGALAAPVVERQPPIAYMRNEGTPNNLIKCTFLCEGAFGVYREPPAPVAVVLPERCVSNPREGYWSGYNDGWNACLDKVKELNQ